MVFFLLLILIVGILLLVGAFFLHKKEERSKYLQKKYTNTREKCVVKLLKLGSQKIQIIKTLKEFIDFDLSMAKEKIESPLPVIISWDMPLDLAQELKVRLQTLDTIIEIIQ